MNNLLLGIITICLFAITIFLIWLLIEIRETVKALQNLTRTMESNLAPTVNEIQITLKGIQKLTDNLNTMAEDTKVFSSSLRTAGEDVRHLSKKFNDVTNSTANKISDIFSRFKNIIEVITKIRPPWGRKKEETNHG